MKKSLSTLILFILSLPFVYSQNSFIKGVDVSALNQIEDNNGIYYENGNPDDALSIFKGNGVNYIRLRIWHTPGNGYTGLEKTLVMAKRIKELGFKFLLDFHYSDTWADPGWQSKPADWMNISFNSLKDSVYEYTYNVITALKNQNTLPDMVQVGNEIVCGMLWVEGQICDSLNTVSQWVQFTELVNEGIRGINESLSQNDSVKIMIHIDRGGDNDGSQWFYNNLIALGVKFDIIGLSFYPWWHGTLNDLRLNVNDLALRYNKEIIIVETAYPWTLGWNDNTHNLVGNSSQLLSGYPATVNGQKDFILDLIDLIKEIPGKKGIGFFYWAPEWISAPTFGSPWENLALFDFQGEVLNSIEAFNTNVNSIKIQGDNGNSFKLYQNYPNPFNPVTKISFSIPLASHVKINVYDLLGIEVETIADEYMQPGFYEKDFNADELTSGIYFYKIISGRYSKTKMMMIVK